MRREQRPELDSYSRDKGTCMSSIIWSILQKGNTKSKGVPDRI